MAVLANGDEYTLPDPREHLGTLKVLPVEAALRPTVEYLAIGDEPTLYKQLIAKSREPNIVAHTPNDAQKRFKDVQSLLEWLAKGRDVHWLLGPGHDLAGIIWYGPSKFPLDLPVKPEPEFTFAIRLYNGYAGKGLAKPFMQQSLQEFVRERMQSGAGIPGIWLQTDVDNPAAVRAYTNFGYHEVSRDEKRVTMVLGPDEVLVRAAAGQQRMAN